MIERFVSSEVEFFRKFQFNFGHLQLSHSKLLSTAVQIASLQRQLE